MLTNLLFSDNQLFHRGTAVPISFFSHDGLSWRTAWLCSSGWSRWIGCSVEPAATYMWGGVRLGGGLRLGGACCSKLEAGGACSGGVAAQSAEAAAGGRSRRGGRGLLWSVGLLLLRGTEYRSRRLLPHGWLLDWDSLDVVRSGSGASFIRTLRITFASHLGSLLPLT